MHLQWRENIPCVFYPYELQESIFQISFDIFIFLKSSTRLVSFKSHSFIQKFLQEHSKIFSDNINFFKDVMFLIFSGKYFNRFLDMLRYIRESVCMKPSIISDDIFVIMLSYKSSRERLYNVSLTGLFSAFK